MVLLNRVSVYTSPEKASSFQSSSKINTNTIETLGNSHSPIVCFISSEGPISESKDVKTLTKIFEKLMLMIQNILVVNVNTCQKDDFVLFSNEYNFKKAFVFGEKAVMRNLETYLKKHEIVKYNEMNILYLNDLTTITTSKDRQLKELSWAKIQELHKKD